MLPLHNAGSPPKLATESSTAYKSSQLSALHTSEPEDEVEKPKKTRLSFPVGAESKAVRSLELLDEE